MNESDFESQQRSIQKPHKPRAREPLERMKASGNGSTSSPTRTSLSPRAKEQSRRSNSEEQESFDTNDSQDSSKDEETELNSSCVDRNSSYESNNYSNKSSNLHMRKNNNRTPNGSKDSGTVKKQNHINLSIKNKESMQWKPDSDSTKNVNLYFLVSVIITITIISITIIVYSKFSSNSATMIRNKYQEENIEKEKPLINESKINQLEQAIKDIQTSFHEQNSDIWDEIIAGIREVIQYPEKISIFLFFANENNTVVCLTESLGNKAKDVLGGEVIIFNPKDLENNTGNVLTMLRPKIERSKIVVIHDLLNINPEAFKALHSVCDSENPMVKGSVYLITMMANGYSNEDALTFVEDQLNHTFSRSMNQDILEALITRITDGAVFPIQPESNALCSSLYSST